MFQTAGPGKTLIGIQAEKSVKSVDLGVRVSGTLGTNNETCCEPRGEKKQGVEVEDGQKGGGEETAQVIPEHLWDWKNECVATKGPATESESGRWEEVDEEEPKRGEQTGYRGESLF